MRILIMNDYLVYGGAEMQSIREKKILEEKGHEAFLLTFDENFPKNDIYYNKNNNYINIPIKKSIVKKTLNIFNINKFNKNLLDKIKKTIEDISPDVIHINNLMLDSLTQFRAISEYKTIQTIRDYTAVCPLGTCIKKNNEVCSGENFNNCYLNCGKSIRDIVKIAAHKKLNKERKKYIKSYISPSENLTKICIDNKYKIKCINNPFDFEKIRNFKKMVDFKKKKFLYYGSIDKNKGVLELLDVFEKFSENKDVELWIAGKIDKNIKEEFECKVEKNKLVSYLGQLRYDDMISVLEKVHTIVVPSIWMENYPNTILEGLSTGTYVIGSNRGGIPGMLSDNRGKVFNINDKDEFLQSLNYAYSLSEDKYKSITKNNIAYVKENNSFEKYYTRILKELKEL